MKVTNFLFKNQSTRQTVAKNIFWLTVSQIASRIIRALIIIYAARILGAAEYGAFSYALGLAGFFSIFSDIGLSSILTREVAQNPEKKSQYFGTAFFIKLALLAGTAFVIITIAPHFSKLENVKPIIPLVALLVVLDGIREFMLAFFRALQKMELEALITSITNVTIAAVGFITISYVANMNALTIAYVGSAGFGTITAIILLRREVFSVIKNFSKNLVRPILKSAVPVIFLELSGVFFMNMDVLMLGWWRGAEEVGWYAGGQRIVQLLYMIPAILGTSIFPVISQLAYKNKEKEKNIIEKTIKLSLLVALPISMGGAILAKPLINLVYGTGYEPGALSFSILIFTIIPVFIGAIVGRIVYAYDKQKDTIKNIALGSAINVALNALLIPKWGIAGAATATIVANITYVTLNWYLIKKLTNARIVYQIKKLILGTIIMAIGTGMLSILEANVILSIIISGIIYFSILVIVREPIINLMHPKEMLKNSS